MTGGGAGGSFAAAGTSTARGVEGASTSGARDMTSGDLIGSGAMSTFATGGSRISSAFKAVLVMGRAEVDAIFVLAGRECSTESLIDPYRTSEIASRCEQPAKDKAAKAMPAGTNPANDRRKAILKTPNVA